MKNKLLTERCSRVRKNLFPCFCTFPPFSIINAMVLCIKCSSFLHVRHYNGLFSVYHRITLSLPICMNKWRDYTYASSGVIENRMHALAIMTKGTSSWKTCKATPYVSFVVDELSKSKKLRKWKWKQWLSLNAGLLNQLHSKREQIPLENPAQIVSYSRFNYTIDIATFSFFKL